ncbi:MAG: IS3 family transposase, partial [Patescibacteria group bacterium]
NGLIQKQYINFHFDELYDTDNFNLGLVEYLTWYNTEKPHRSLAKMSPLQYFVNNFTSPQKSNMLWTATSTWRKSQEGVE